MNDSNEERKILEHSSSSSSISALTPLKRTDSNQTKKLRSEPKSSPQPRKNISDSEDLNSPTFVRKIEENGTKKEVEANEGNKKKSSKEIKKKHRSGTKESLEIEAMHESSEDRSDEEESLKNLTLSESHPTMEDLRRKKETLKKQKESLRKEEENLKKQSKNSFDKQRKQWKKQKEDILREVKMDLKRKDQMMYRLSNDSYKDLEDVVVGWVKMRDGFKKWHSRWLVLRPGRLIYYRDEFDKDCLGIILLNGTKVKARQTKRKGFAFKIWHPEDKSIYSSKGLKGETRFSAKLPIGFSYCIFLCKTEEERALWMKGIEICQSDIIPVNFVGKYNIVIEKNEPIDEEINMSSEESDDNEDHRKIIHKGTRYQPQIVDDKYKEGNTEEEIPPTFKNLIFTLLKQVKPGMDLSRLVLPTFILEPRSTLEKLTDFLTHSEILAEVPKLKNPQDRMITFLKWYFSGFYIKPEGVKKPYNPILGEVCRCMWEHQNGTKTFYISEQVSHHPPISAFYASNRKEGFIINGSILFSSKFLGTYAASILDGFASVYILPYDEEYEITFPSAHAKGFLFGKLIMELVGLVTVTCRKTGYKAEIEFRSKPFLRSDYNIIQAKIKKGKEVIFNISGKWDSKLEITNVKTNECTVLWEPTPEIRQNRVPMQKPLWEDMKENESDKLWNKVTDAIKKGDQQAATDEKTVLEERQRKEARERQERSIIYKPKLFFQHNGNWVYKKFNKEPFNEETEIDEYEYKGLILSRKKNEEEDAKELMDALEEEKIEDDSVDDFPPEVSNGPKPIEKFEQDLLRIEKKILTLQHRAENKQTKSTDWTLIFFMVVVFFIFYYFHLRISFLESQHVNNL